MFKSSRNNVLMIACLIAFFGFYNVLIYTSKGRQVRLRLSTAAIAGQQLWQNNNCWSCHQVYGLGGYLGPDLTNVISAPGKGPGYVKAFLNSGIKAMPKFNFSEQEKEAIVAFLQSVDSTGLYPNHDADFKFTGWVELKYRNER